MIARNGRGPDIYTLRWLAARAGAEPNQMDRSAYIVAAVLAGYVAALFLLAWIGVLG